jgi:diguanylate cyclase (GGDEF)-like protein
MTRASRQRQKMGLLLVDIDHFKRINDSYGHVTGDSVLKLVAAALESQLRPYDAAGRYGGEEFLIVVPGVNHVRSIEVAERLRMSVVENVMVPASGDTVTVSVGVAVTTGEEPLETVVEAADRALYAAKAGGRNRVELARPRKPMGVVVDLDDRIREYSGA